MNDTIGIQTAKVAALKKQKEDIEAQEKYISGKFHAECEILLKMLEASELNSINAHGYTFYINSSMSVTTPKSYEDKQALFNFLKERGIFDDYISVNSKSLNSLYNKLAEEALENGIIEFSMPGIEEPKEVKTLRLRAK